MHPAAQFARRALALSAGASGYLTKDSAPEELLAAIGCAAGAPVGKDAGDVLLR